MLWGLSGLIHQNFISHEETPLSVSPSNWPSKLENGSRPFWDPAGDMKLYKVLQTNSGPHIHLYLPLSTVSLTNCCGAWFQSLNRKLVFGSNLVVSI